MEQSQTYIQQYNTDLNEGFIVPVQSNVIVKTLLYGLLFYIIANSFVNDYLKSKLPRSIEPTIIQAIIFGLLYYIISVNI